MALTKSEREALIRIDLNIKQLIKNDDDKETRIRSLERKFWAMFGSSLLLFLAAIITALVGANQQP